VFTIAADAKTLSVVVFDSDDVMGVTAAVHICICEHICICVYKYTFDNLVCRGV